MKVLTITCLLGSAAALALVAEMPAANAEPVEYVKVCSLYGSNYFYAPGTDVCMISAGPGKVQSSFGTISNFSGTNADLYGQHAFAYGDNSTALGDNAWAGGDPTSASPGALGGLFSLNGNAPGTSFMNYGTTAVGEGAKAGAGADGQNNATAVGQAATANAVGASSFGQGSNASGSYSTAVGTSSAASGDYSIASGMSAQATGFGAVAIGSGDGGSVTGASASGKYALAIGSGSNATQTGSIAMGNNASSTGANAIAIGTGAVATGSVAVGNGSSASGGGAATGDFASATGSKSAAFGYGASASAAGSLALGAGAIATGANSVAIGAGSIATDANSVSFGTPGSPRRLTNIAPGTGPNDAVNNQQFSSGLSDTLAKAQSYTDKEITGFGSGMRDLKSQAFGGIAAAVAMGSASMPSAPGRTTLAVHASQFENYTGAGISVAHRLDADIPLSIDAGYAHSANEDIGRVGMEVEF